MKNTIVRQAHEQPQRKEMLLHALMYAVNIYSETQDLVRTLNDKESETKFFSQGVTQLQIFAEFMLDMLSEQSEPFVLFLEIAKAILRLKEYRSLAKKDKIKTFVDFEKYNQIKLREKHAASLFQMTRSQRSVTRPKEPVVSAGYADCLLRQTKAKDSWKKPQPREKQTKSFFSTLGKLITNYAVGSNFSLDEVIAILRPVVFVWLVLKRGKHSSLPLKVCLWLDIVSAVIGMLRIRRSNEQEQRETQTKQHLILSSDEKQQIKQRIRTSFLKYLIRDPIFTSKVMPFASSVLTKLRVPPLMIGYFASYVNYFRFYAYIS